MGSDRRERTKWQSDELGKRVPEGAKTSSMPCFGGALRRLAVSMAVRAKQSDKAIPVA